MKFSSTGLLHNANFLLGSDGVGIDNRERELDRVKVMIRLAGGNTQQGESTWRSRPFQAGCRIARRPAGSNRPGEEIKKPRATNDGTCDSGRPALEDSRGHSLG